MPLSGRIVWTQIYQMFSINCDGNKNKRLQQLRTSHMSSDSISGRCNCSQYPFRLYTYEIVYNKFPHLFWSLHLSCRHRTAPAQYQLRLAVLIRSAVEIVPFHDVPTWVSLLIRLEWLPTFRYFSHKFCECINRWDKIRSPVPHILTMWFAVIYIWR